MMRRETFRIQKNKVTGMVRRKRNHFIDQHIQETMQDSKKMWQAMKLALNKNVSTNHDDLPETIESLDGQLLKEPKQIVDALNEHFLDIGERLNNEQFTKKNNRPRVSTTDYECQSSMNLSKTSQHELNTIIHTLKSDAASGMDGISAKNLKAVSRQLSRELVIPINVCLKNGTFSSSFKEAKIKALYKGSGSKKKPTNYRPISVLCNLSKILEKLLYSRMFEFLSQNHVIAENQFGFLPKSSTTSAALHAITRIKRSLDEQCLTAAVCIDIAKAFDSVHHETLLNKLNDYGIRGKTLQIIQDYLFGRRQVVASGELKSNPGCMKYGVPQGSNLSSLLFLIYINGCLTLNLHAHIQMYADDALLIYSTDTYDHLKTAIQEDLTQIDNWLYNNYLTFNADKTNLMVFKTSSRVTHQSINIVMNNTPIQEVACMTYLGLVVDNELKWKQHHDLLKKKLMPY